METALLVVLGAVMALIGKIIAMFWIEARNQREWEARVRPPESNDEGYPFHTANEWLYQRELEDMKRVGADPLMKRRQR